MAKAERVNGGQRVEDRYSRVMNERNFFAEYARARGIQTEEDLYKLEEDLALYNFGERNLREVMHPNKVKEWSLFKNYSYEGFECWGIKPGISPGRIILPSGRILTTDEMRSSKHLTTTEFALSGIFIALCGVTASRKELQDRALVLDNGKTRSVDVHVRRIRGKWESDAIAIVSDRGIGYRLNPSLLKTS